MEDAMKKTIAFLLAVIMILSLTACDSQPESAPSSFFVDEVAVD